MGYTRAGVATRDTSSPTPVMTRGQRVAAWVALFSVLYSLALYSIIPTPLLPGDLAEQILPVVRALLFCFTKILSCCIASLVVACFIRLVRALLVRMGFIYIPRRRRRIHRASQRASPIPDSLRSLLIDCTGNHTSKSRAARSGCFCGLN
jgi:hypothetical protein